jgi:hypothetical protein
MHNEFTAIIEEDEGWSLIARKYPELTARESLADAIALILEDRRKDILRLVPKNSLREVVTSCQEILT